jgi:hypothetical protein
VTPKNRTTTIQDEGSSGVDAIDGGGGHIIAQLGSWDGYEVESCWEEQPWYHRAIRSRIEPLKVFARRLKPYLPGILAHCRWPLPT